jgi:hypothetical protein
MVLGLANLASLITLAPTWYPAVSSRVWIDAAAYYKPLRESIVYTQNDRSVWLQYANPKSFASVQTDKSVLDFLVSGIPNIPGTWGVVSQGGYEPVAPKSTMAMQGWTGAEPQRDLERLSDLGVTHVMSISGRMMPLQQYRLQPATRVVNGWKVHPVTQNNSVRLKVRRAAGWEVVSGGNLVIVPRRDNSVLTLSGYGSIAYQPASFRLGLFVTLVALGILAGITLHTVQNARKV